MEEKTYARVGVALDPSDIKRLAELVPRGSRSVFVRQMISLGLDAIAAIGPAAVGLILTGDITLAPKSSNDQNLISTKRPIKTGKIVRDW